MSKKKNKRVHNKQCKEGTKDVDGIEVNDNTFAYLIIGIICFGLVIAFPWLIILVILAAIGIIAGE